MIIHINTEEPEMRTFELSEDEKTDLHGSIDYLCKCFAQLTFDFLSRTVSFEHCIKGKDLIFGVASDYFDKLVGSGFADTPVNEEELGIDAEKTPDAEDSEDVLYTEEDLDAETRCLVDFVKELGILAEISLKKYIHFLGEAGGYANLIAMLEEPSIEEDVDEELLELQRKLEAEEISEEELNMEELDALEALYRAQIKEFNIRLTKKILSKMTI